MQPRRFDQLNATVATDLSAAQVLAVEATVQRFIAANVTDVALARRTNVSLARRRCPHCRSGNVGLHGKDKNARQRFKCRACNRTYNILTGTPMARARKPALWAGYLECMTDHMTVRRIAAAGIGISHVTAWRWRHRFLTATASDVSAMLCGVIEAGVTVFPASFKGKRRRVRDTTGAHHAAPEPAATGDAPRPPAAVLSALDSGGGMYDTILGSPADIGAALFGRIAGGSVLCSDATAGFVTVADDAEVEHRLVCAPPAALPPAVTGGAVAVRLPPRHRLGLGRLRDYQRRLRWLVYGRCRGVATKYLGNYLGWHRAMSRPGFVGTRLLQLALA